MAQERGFPSSSIAIIQPRSGLPTNAFWRLLASIWRRAGGWEDGLSDLEAADQSLFALINSLESTALENLENIDKSSRVREPIFSDIDTGSIEERLSRVESLVSNISDNESILEKTLSLQDSFQNTAQIGRDEKNIEVLDDGVRRSSDATSFNFVGGGLVATGTSDKITVTGTDYETGTFNPTIAFATPGTSSFAYTTQFGRYTKIGRIYILECFIQFTPTIGTGSGDVRISDLPVTANSAVFGAGPISTINSNWTWPAGYSDLSVRPVGSTSYCQLRFHGGAVSSVTCQASDLTNGATHFIGFSLFVAE